MRIRSSCQIWRLWDVCETTSDARLYSYTYVPFPNALLTFPVAHKAAMSDKRCFV